MSHRWHVRCLDCADTHYFDDANRQVGFMLTLCRHADSIAAVAELLKAAPDVRLTTLWGDICAEWFLRHLGHNLQPIDEYGRAVNQCYLRVVCDCGTSHDCDLELRHEGPCRSLRVKVARP